MDTLFQAFQRSARLFESRIALIDFHTGKSLSYGELLQLVEKLVHRIRKHCPLDIGDRVGLLMSNQAEFIVSFFALQALGAVAIPLSYRLATREHREILNHAGAIGLIGSTDFAESYSPLLPILSWFIQAEPLEAGMATENTCFSISDWLSQHASNTHPIANSLSSQELALLIYTSGTTGKPKGVMLSHKNLLEDAKANAAVIEATSHDVFVTASPLFHVFGLTNILLTGLLQGASIVLIKRFNPKSLLEAITRYQVSFLAAVPTMYQMMLSLLPSKSYDFGSLRVCHSGAAPMPGAVFKQIERQFGVPVQEGYGQSEASSIVTSNPLHGARKPGSVGLPLPGIRVEVVNAQDEPLVPGEIGELRVQGDTVMLGYWNDPEATDRAVRNGWLYTSDMGYKDQEGYIYLAGRRDDMINAGGVNVYPQEVENVLYQHPGVASCAVAAEASELYGQTVAAYVVLHPDSTASSAELQKFCRKRIGEHKVPKKVYFVEEIPKGATGKVLRNRLGKNVLLYPLSTDSVQNSP